MKLETILLLSLLTLGQQVLAEETKRVPAQDLFDRMIYTYPDQKPNTTHIPYRMWDPKFKVVCYGTVSGMADGGSSIFCLQK